MEKQKCNQCTKVQSGIPTPSKPRGKTAVATMLLLGAIYGACTIVSIKNPEMSWITVPLVIFGSTSLFILVLIIEGNFIGRKLHSFFDQTNNFHTHNKMPAQVPGGQHGGRYIAMPEAYGDTTNLSMSNSDGNEFLVKGAIFKYRVGGWFRKNEIIKDGRGGELLARNWQISHSWTGKDLRIRERCGYEYGAHIAELVQMVNELEGASSLQFGPLGPLNLLGRGIFRIIQEAKKTARRCVRNIKPR